MEQPLALYNDLVEESRFYEIRLREDQVVEIHILPKSDICIDEVKILIRESLRLTKGVPHPVLIVVGEFTTFSGRARSFSATAEGKAACTAEAYVINNMGHSIIGNFYLKFNQPVKPVKIFWNEEDALKWLEQFPV